MVLLFLAFRGKLHKSLQGGIKLKKRIYISTLVAFLLTACNKEAEPTPVEKVESSQEEIVTKAWPDMINELAANGDVATDKYYALEKYMMSYKTNENEVSQFKQNILASYKDKTYLANSENHEQMLNQIFQSYIVEQNTADDWNDFAFDYFQNVKYVYKRLDTVDGEAVKANEIQMNHVLPDLN